MSIASAALSPSWLPRTLSARILLTLAGGLLLAHALSFALLFYERASATRSMMLTNLEQDIPVSVALLEHLPATERTQWLPQLERRTYRYLLRPARAGTPLASDRARQVTALIDDALMHRYALRPRAVGASPERFEVELNLADGQPLTIEVTPAPLPIARWLPWVLAAQVLLLLGCSWWAVRLATRPLARLADAADRLDPAQPGQPLLQEGPSEVARAATALNALQARVSAHVAERTQILAAISHDLQTPITRMRLRLDAMEETPEQARLLEDVQQISQLVREGVNYARGAHASLGPSVRLDLPSFLDSVVADYQDTGKPVQRIEGASASVQTHPQVLRRIVQNLIDNALAYGGSAETRLRQQADGGVAIEVLDRGPGIPEDQLKAVLQPFHRLESSRSRSTGGTGLGLAIAQQLSQALGGTLSLSNRDGGGLQARVTLPPTTNA
ncbi:HAMP domain-containing sensor histidine kinase [Pseudoxanthomonas indica]|uniref:histidine kinase n=1 Tax=Pseudoxanthomonas indica TaxID=428993 RepID=A0A1T5KPC2_9GAMM|nr:HAMP domain-containing sensor histidine kinase [Pseudoxanthomonas indica]GGD50675.1 protein BfmS [Pseudoxanthomonas indica]SKC65582.1 Signal transduction histidine kinase [Pseudoxanthomonas indica]